MKYALIFSVFIWKTKNNQQLFLAEQHTFDALFCYYNCYLPWWKLLRSVQIISTVSDASAHLRGSYKCGASLNFLLLKKITHKWTKLNRNSTCCSIIFTNLLFFLATRRWYHFRPISTWNLMYLCKIDTWATWWFLLPPLHMSHPGSASIFYPITT